MDSAELNDRIRRAEGGSTVAQSILGLLYLDGTELPLDYAKALHWLTLAAEKGASRPLLHLGIMYERGLGVEVDLEKAFRLYQRSADRREWLAYIHLARMFRHGKGTGINEPSALEWYEAALSEAGNVQADEELNEAREFIQSRRGCSA
jgi:hypothetical protein